MIRGLLFDINGTVTDICTNEEHDEIYRVLSNFFDYQGISLSPAEMRRLYFEINKRQRRDSKEEFPEFDVVALFREMIDSSASAYTRSLPKKKLKLLPEIAAELFRAASRFRLQLYPDVKKTLDKLKKKYRMAAVSDGQRLWAEAELYAVGLADYFDPVIVSSDYGYRKPDAGMFKKALKEMKLEPSEVIFIGNDMYRDVSGACNLGIKTIFFRSNQGEHYCPGTCPDYVIQDFSQLPDAVRFLEKLEPVSKKSARKKVK